MEVIKKRTFDVQGVRGQADASEIEQALLLINGIRKAAVDPSGQLSIEYDLRLFGVVKLEQAIQRLGYSLGEAVWSRIRRGWLRFSEQNELDNLTAPVRPCCSDPKEVVDRRS